MLGPGLPAAHALEVGLVTDLTWFPGTASNQRTAQLLADSGSRWVRLSVGWHDFEPSRGVDNPWSVSAYATEIARARAAGQRVLLMVSETPGWASGSTDRYAPPRDPADFGRFIGHLAALYGDSVDAYEVWNEPNIARFWKPAPDAAAYARLLRAAYPAVKREDPSARVVFAGPSTNDRAFVEAAYAAGAKGAFDVLGAHPYSCESPDTVRRDADGRLNRGSFLSYRELRAVALSHGDDPPIWFTEFGWSTYSGSCGVSEAQQAAYLSRALELTAADDHVEVALVYGLRNVFTAQDDDSMEGQFGLLRTDFSAKPAYGAFVAFARGSSGLANGAVVAPPAAPDPGLPASPSPTLVPAGAQPAPATVPAVGRAQKAAGARPRTRGNRRLARLRARKVRAARRARAASRRPARGRLELVRPR